jgi:hypothetical protein
MSISTKERRDDIIYFLLNKVKHTEQPQTVSFFAEDFDGKVVEGDEVRQHLEYVIETGYLQGSATVSESDDTVLAVCDDARLTSEGEEVLRTKYFKV